MSIDKNDEPDQRSPELNNQKTVKTGFGDPSGNFPRQEYFFEPTTNKAARGASRNELNLGGGLAGLGITLPNQISSQYPYNNVRETLSGHVVEYDDTPGGERVLIKHRSGSGIELRADGSVVMKTQNNSVQVVSGSSALIVEGDVDIKANGNMNLSVAGDLNIDVGGNINVSAAGNKQETIQGSSRELVYGQSGSVVKGSRSNTTVGVVTDLALASRNDIVKGSHRQSIDGDAIWGISGSLKQTAADKMIISTPDMNLAATDLSIFGASGTIGGANLVHYGVTFYGTTFHGDLNGTAALAVQADLTNSQNYNENSTGSASGYSITNDTTATANASASTLSSYLTESAYGVQKISVDPGSHIVNLIDRTEANFGLSDKELTTNEVRSILRDPANSGNSDFVASAAAAGKISNSYSRKTPSAIGRLANNTGQIRIPRVSMPTPRLTTSSRFKASKNKDVIKYIVDPIYNPNNIATNVTIDGSTQLSKNIRLSKFLSGTGDKVTLSHIATRAEKLAIARQFMLHVEAVKTIARDTGEFKNHRLVVAEGLYKVGPSETLTAGSVNDRATRGEAIVYELHNNEGIIDVEKTYDLALYWKDTLNFDKLILDYDTYDPSGSLNAQIILIMPQLRPDYTFVNNRYANELETLFNNNTQGAELIEVTSA